MDAIIRWKVAVALTTWGERLLMKEKRCTEGEAPDQEDPGRGCRME